MPFFFSSSLSPWREHLSCFRTGICSQTTKLPVYWLQVHKPRAAILGSREKHVNLGDSVTISCELRDSVSEPEAVFWYHKDSMINYLPGMVVITSMIGPDPDSLWVAPPNTTVSRLTIAKAETAHGGKYTCAPTLADRDSVRLFVIQGSICV